jgi:hypothetical protein
MIPSQIQLRTAATALGIFVLALAAHAPQPVLAQDLFNRVAESDLMLRDVRRAKGLQLTVEVRFLTTQGDFLEQVGVDFEGTLRGSAHKNGQPVEGAKIILEVYKVQAASQPQNSSAEVVTRTGRTTLETDSDGSFSISLRKMVDADSRKEVLNGEVISLRMEATGKNGKKLDHLRLQAEVGTGGLIP